MKISKKGYTLIEMMIVVAISGILAVVAAPLFKNLYIAYRVSSDNAQIARSASTLTHLLNIDIRNTSKIEEQWNGYKTSEESIILKIPISKQQGYYHIVYFRDSKDKRKLIKQVFTNKNSAVTPSRQVICSDLKDINFSIRNNKGNSLVTTKTVFTRRFGKRQHTKEFSSSVFTRNGGQL